MWTTYQLAANERGLLLRDGTAEAWLGPGRHRYWGGAPSLKLERFDLNAHFAVATPELLAVLAGSSEAVEHTVDAHELGFLSADGLPVAVLTPGRWLLWQARAKVSAQNVSLAGVLVQLPAGFRALVPAGTVETVLVQPYERVLLFADGRLESSLEAGLYDVSRWNRAVSVTRVDLRERELQIVGQELMTADKVSLRLNVVVRFHVTDAVKSVFAVQQLETGLYSEVQLAARRYVGGLTVDGLLEKRNDASSTLRADLEERLAAWGVALDRVDLKDVVLPGDMKSLLNQVIEAEKRAAANVILRREETAATRSLANTAKLLESNPTLLRLKELEAWKELAQSVGQLHVVAAPQQLLSALSLTAPPALPDGKKA